MELPFVTLDVFTTTRFRGNPLAVVTVPAPPAPQPTQDQKQAIAREFNLSETVFVHDVAPSERSTAAVSSRTRHIDIFLTTREINFAGHPTIGTAISLLPEGVETLVTKAGPIPITKLSGGGYVRAEIPHDLHLHAIRLRDLVAREEAAGGQGRGEGGGGRGQGEERTRRVEQLQLSRRPVIRDAELNAPVFSIVQGMTFVLVELPSLEALAAVEFGHLPPDDLLCDQGWRGGFVSKYYFVRTTGEQHDGRAATASPKGPGPGLDVLFLRTRMLEDSFEDPATGSAACCLASYLSATEGGRAGDGDSNGNRDEIHTRKYEITQGVEMGKESNIHVEVTVKASTVQSVFLAGTAIQVM